MKKYLRHLSIYVFVLGSILTSCNSKKSEQSVPAPAGISELAIEDSLKISIDVSKIDSMVRLFDSGATKAITNDDCISLGDMLSTAQYDTVFNNSDIMVKMQTPEYTVILYNKGKTLEENDWLMVWKENGRTKYKNKWYYLAEDKKDIVYNLLDKYKENSN